MRNPKQLEDIDIDEFAHLLEKRMKAKKKHTLYDKKAREIKYFLARGEIFSLNLESYPHEGTIQYLFCTSRIFLWVTLPVLRTLLEFFFVKSENDPG